MNIDIKTDSRELPNPASEQTGPNSATDDVGSFDSNYAEFDQFASDYHRQHQKNIAISGESPEYFSEYKIADLANLIKKSKNPATKILDFGSGIGNSLPYFRKYFPSSIMSCADVSARSIDIAQRAHQGSEQYFLIDGDQIPVHDASHDIVFSACVFHHILHEKHHHWLLELQRVTRPGGLLVIYEHNPLNPLTVRAVNTCPFDINARLIRAAVMRQRALTAGWNQVGIDYRVFFPSCLSMLRPVERHLGWLGIGAQYRLSAIRALG